MAGRPDPRITEWPIPRTVESETLPLYPSVMIKKRKDGSDFYEICT